MQPARAASLQSPGVAPQCFKERWGNAMLAKSRYHEIYARWQRDPSGFWAEAARGIDWYEPAKTIFDPGAGVYGRWFAGASCNTCFNALDRHVAGGRGKQTA